MLPRGKNLDHTISERKENALKNRYNDIKAADATRVRLKRLDNSSDYINANFIKVLLFNCNKLKLRAIEIKSFLLLLKDPWNVLLAIFGEWYEFFDNFNLT